MTAEREDGAEIVPDDMPPAVRAQFFLLEHANRRRVTGASRPCSCQECEHHRMVLKYARPRFGL